MIVPEEFVGWLAEQGINRYAGVPDSLLSPLIESLDASTSTAHVVTASEGGAVGYAIGAFLESGSLCAVYMQNSGLGNAVNPLISLAHEKVYGIPMVLIIGWRGEPGRDDEPQHLVQGQVTVSLLDTLGIPSIILETDSSKAGPQIHRFLSEAATASGPIAILVRNKTFARPDNSIELGGEFSLSREDALEAVAQKIPNNSRVIASTGMLGRELWELRERTSASHHNDFLVVGGMGHASSIALGIAEANPDVGVWCLDGDGAILMHLGSLAVIGQQKPANLRHIVFNNFAHDSVGGQSTAMGSVDTKKLIQGLGYTWLGSAATFTETSELSAELAAANGPGLVEVRIRTGARSNLGRPSQTIFAPRARFLNDRERH